MFKFMGGRGEGKRGEEYREEGGRRLCSPASPPDSGTSHGHVFDMCSDIPGIPERVLYPRASITVSLVGWFGDRSFSRRQRAPIDRIRIRHIEIEHGWHRRTFPLPPPEP